MKNHILLLTVIFLFTFVSCSKKQEGNSNGDKSTQNATDKPNDKTTQNTQQNDIAYFGRWDGKRIIIEDYYKLSSYENMKDSTGAGYETYGQSLKDIINKYQKYDEQKAEYYFDDYKAEFEKYTGLKKGDKINIAAQGGVYPAEISGYYINMDDMIGGGTVFYAYVNPPAGAKFEENEIVVCSQNGNMKTVNSKGVTNQQVLDEFKGYIMPKLKGIKVTSYDENGEQKNGPLTKLANEDIKLFEGSFTGAGKNEFLVSVKLQNDFTNFTSLIYVMDGDGKIISELAPLAVNNFTFSSADGVVDINGDGVLEIITYDGYYEGGGNNLQKYNGGLYKVLTSGFMFGV